MPGKRRHARVLSLILAGGLSAQVGRAAAADAAFGQYLSSECVTCHRADGADKGIPPIVGWPTDQFVAVLKSYKVKDRPSAIMQTVAGKLSDEEIEALATYYASLGGAKK